MVSNEQQQAAGATSVGRWIRVVLALALAVSVAANVLAAESSVVGRGVAAWFPVALLLVVDVLSRAPRSSGWLGWVVAVATGLVAVAAAVASFSHMREVALSAGESPLVAVLFPLTVDGLAVVCSAALVELARRGPGGGRGVVSVEGPDSDDSTVSGSGSQRSLSQSVPVSDVADTEVLVGSGWVPVAAASSNGVVHQVGGRDPEGK